MHNSNSLCVLVSGETLEIELKELKTGLEVSATIYLIIIILYLRKSKLN